LPIFRTEKTHTVFCSEDGTLGVKNTKEQTRKTSLGTNMVQKKPDNKQKTIKQTNKKHFKKSFSNLKKNNNKNRIK
jgi:hypothetical protein